MKDRHPLPGIFGTGATGSKKKWYGKCTTDFSLKAKKLLVGLAGGWLFLGPAWALDESQTARYETWVHELRCLVCQNQTIAESNAPLAADLREQVRAQIGQGRSDEQIRVWLTDRYGDFVLYDPPLAPRTWLLWTAPFLLLALGLGVVLRQFRFRSAA